MNINKLNEFIKFRSHINRKLAILSCTFIFVIMTVILFKDYMIETIPVKENSFNLRSTAIIVSSISLFILAKTKNYKLINGIIFTNMIIVILNNIIRNQILFVLIDKIDIYIIILSLIYIVFSFEFKIQIIVGFSYSLILLFNILAFSINTNEMIANMLLIIASNIISYKIGKMYETTQNKIFENSYEIQEQIKLLETNKEHIKKLAQFLNICKICHSIKNDKGVFENIENYYKENNLQKFSHTICPDCK